MKIRMNELNCTFLDRVVLLQGFFFFSFSSLIVFMMSKDFQTGLLPTIKMT